jgi:hypothetical protein
MLAFLFFVFLLYESEHSAGDYVDTVWWHKYST